VRRWWPDVVDIELRERVAFGYWGAGEMIDVNGRRFRPPIVRQPGPWPQLPDRKATKRRSLKPMGKFARCLSRWDYTGQTAAGRTTGLVADLR